MVDFNCVDRFTVLEIEPGFVSDFRLAYLTFA